MNRRINRVLLMAIVLGTVILAASGKMTSLQANDSVQETAYLPAVRSTFALAISPVVSNIVPPRIITDIVDPGDGRLFIATRDGRIQVSSPDGVLQQDLLLDIRDKVLDNGNESGLVGLAVHPDFVENGYFYVFYVEESSENYYAVVARYVVGKNDQADPADELRILRFELPTLIHHGGALHFGPNDGYLYIASGDGGTRPNRDNDAQSTDSLLGKILRIDVDGESPYAIPPDNPFIDDSKSRDEIWALGFRNPWRFSFDRETGDMYIGDVGNIDWEEIDFISADSSGGENFGWPCREGPVEYGRDACDYNNNYIDPIHSYPQDQCAAVVGGFVYRGTELPEMYGQYIFADLCDGVLWSLTPMGDQEWQPRNWGNLGQRYTTFGERHDGEILLGAYDKTIYQLARP